MYIYKRLKTSRSVLTILLIGLALVVWGVLGPTGISLAKKGGAHKTLHLNVTFEEDGGNRITSDGNPTYSDGEDNVVAIARDRFRFDTTRGASSHKGGKRTVTLDFTRVSCGSPLDGREIETPVDMRLCYKWEDGVDVLDEFPDVDGMPVDMPSQVAMCIHFSYDGDPYGLAFGNLYQFTGEVDPGTDPVIVTRTGHETWEIEAPPGGPGRFAFTGLEGREPPLRVYQNAVHGHTGSTRAQKGREKGAACPNLSSELTSTWGRMKAER